MPTSKRTTQSKTTPKPKAQEPKKAPVAKTLGELKAKYLADKAADPHKAQEITAQYQKDKAAL